MSKIETYSKLGRMTHVFAIRYWLEVEDDAYVIKIQSMVLPKGVKDLVFFFLLSPIDII